MKEARRQSVEQMIAMHEALASAYSHDMSAANRARAAAQLAIAQTMRRQIEPLGESLPQAIAA